MTREELERLGGAALPILAILSFASGVGATLAVAGDTLGYDFLAYHQAAARLLNGQALYDMSYTETGGFGLFYYPPTFAPLIVPLGLLAATSATWVWICGSLLAFVVGIWILPVSRTVRWWILLLAGLSFPFVYAIKLGQVGPVLFLAFAVGWRWLENPVRLGVSAALGAAIKLQPGVILAWALFTGRVRAAVVGVLALAVLAVLAAPLTGLDAWADFLTLVRTVTDPITTKQNLTPGAVAYQLGAPIAVAAVIQVANAVGVAVAFFAAIRWSTGESSYLVAVIVSQLVSPILWDHYAMLLLLPVAYLLAAGRWWALAIPLVTAWPLVGVTPAIAYPVVFWVTLLATLLVGRTARAPAAEAA